MDPTQITIILVTLTLTILIVVLGIQVFYILKEMRRAIEKMNKMLGDFGSVTGTVSEGVTGMAGFVNGLKTGLSVFTSLKKKEEDE